MAQSPKTYTRSCHRHCTLRQRRPPLYGGLEPAATMHCVSAAIHPLWPLRCGLTVRADRRDARDVVGHVGWGSGR
eukprot:273228-Rhodomonas_salina.1